MLDNIPMKAFGTLSKMKSGHNDPISYQIILNHIPVEINQLIGRSVSLKYSGNILCENCGKKTKKSYSQGYCYPCTMKLASCDLCIMKPETCHYEKGTCRDPAWGLENCFKPTIVYLANSSGLKVGITRASSIPTRWIDQGATQALPLMEVKNRFVSGQIEMLFKTKIADKTDWRKMLKGIPASIDLLEWREKLLLELGPELEKFEIKMLEPKILSFTYPVEKYLEKINSFNLDKTPEIHSKLLGVKGQYLIFEDGVLNVRSYTGYEVTIEAQP
jgi:Protein of unknown function (DUF2797)